MAIKIALSSHKNSDINIYSDRHSSGLKYANDVVQLSRNPRKLPVFLDRINDSVGMFNVLVAPSKFKILLQN